MIKALDGDMYGDVPRPEILPQFRQLPGAVASIDMGVPETSPGSNNWAIGGKLTGTGAAIMVDDPHRQVTNPAHRYLLHLNAPGWNVAGATEAPLAGVIRGHNGRVAWGRTATETDQADVYVETVNPANPNEVLWNGKWEPLRVITEEIRVKGARSAAGRTEVQPSRPDLLRGPRTSSRVCAAVAVAGARHGRVPRRAAARPGDLGARLPDRGELHADAADESRMCRRGRQHLVPGRRLRACAQGLDRTAAGPGHRASMSGARSRRTDLPSEYNPDRGFIATANNNTQPPASRRRTPTTPPAAAIAATSASSR